MGRLLVDKLFAAACGEGVLGRDAGDGPRYDHMVLGVRSAVRVLSRLGARPAAAPDRLTFVLPGRRGPEPDVEVMRHAVRAFAADAGAARLEAAAAGDLPAVLADGGAARPGRAIAGEESSLHALGALGVLVLQGDAETLAAAIATGVFERAPPPTLRVRFAGRPGRFSGGHDLGLKLLGALGREGARGFALELAGPAVDALDVVERMALCARAALAGAECVLIAVDEKTLAWLRARCAGQLVPLLPDKDAAPVRIETVDVEDLGPLVARAADPFAPRALSDVPELPLDKVALEAPCGARIEQLRAVARLAKEHSVAPGVRASARPDGPRTLLHAVEEGVVATLLRSGFALEAPGAPDEHEAFPLAAGERGLTTGTAGGLAAAVGEAWLAGAPVAVASAIFGRIAHPDEVLRRQREAV